MGFFLQMEHLQKSMKIKKSSIKDTLDVPDRAVSKAYYLLIIAKTYILPAIDRLQSRDFYPAVLSSWLAR